MRDLPAEKIRRLPVVPRPLPRESLLSWLDYMATMYAVPRKDMARACGLLGPGDKATRIEDSGPSSITYGLSDADAARAEQATGLEVEDLQHMTWLRFLETAVKPELADAAPRDRFAVMKASWIDPRELRFCPSCIQETDGRWFLEWCTPWAFACLRHGCYLLSECPTCRTALRTGDVKLANGRCRGVERHRLLGSITWRCGIEYRKMQAPVLRDDSLAELQLHLEQHLAWPQPTSDQAKDDLADLTAMAEFALYAATPEHLDGADPVVRESFTEFCASTTLGNYRTIQGNPSPTARTAALRVASQIVFSADPWSSARKIADFASRPLPSHVVPLHQAWLKQRPRDTTRRLERIVRSVRIAAPSIRTPDRRVVPGP
ncbi:TniQ family protein [Streptomyces sp. P6-2-1]|uniref:TniQ family protein n=1 Tax=Streptomyces sp. P6-2-1 TaxID=3422591 RepID=UPI003D3661B0